MSNQTLYNVALTQVNGIGAVQAKQLLDFFGNAEDIFKASLKSLSALDGIGEIKAKAIKDFSEFKGIEIELEFCEKHHIQIIGLKDVDYPKRLLQCFDAPTVLYYRGNVDLNTSKIVSIIGTRTNSDYGKQMTEQIIKALNEQQVLIVSGLAFGIDAISHRAALDNGLPTIGVLAHGLDSIYPAQHKNLASEMLKNGGLLTEFPRLTKPDKHNFPRRNRIVAGISDATIVIETALKGGSMITADLAFNYNRDLFAVPGKLTDAKSSGCIKLIQQNKAIIYTNEIDFAEVMGWQPKKKKPTIQRQLFTNLSEEDQKIINILSLKESTHIDDLFIQSGLSSGTIATCLLTLELQNIIIVLPGKMYMLA